MSIFGSNIFFGATGVQPVKAKNRSRLLLEEGHLLAPYKKTTNKQKTNKNAPSAA